MKKYLYLVALVLTLSAFNSAQSQTFPRVNNDTTYLRKITVEEGARADMPIYMDTTSINGLKDGMVLSKSYNNRFYSRNGILLIFKDKYISNEEKLIPFDSVITNENKVLNLLDTIYKLYGYFYLTDY